MSRAAAELACPDCRGAMREQTQHGIRLDRCACGGLWFDGEELDAFEAKLGDHPQNRLARSSRRPRKGATLRCPRCAADKLLPKSARGLGFSACPECRGHFLTNEQIERWKRERVRRSRAKDRDVANVAELLNIFFWL